MTASSPYEGGTREAVAYCLRRTHLRRTTRIAFVVGLLTWVRSAANFVIPFIVSNLGLLSGRGARSGTVPTVGSVDHEH